MGQPEDHYYFKLAQVYGASLTVAWIALTAVAVRLGCADGMYWLLSTPLAVLAVGSWFGGRFLQWFYFGGHA